MIGNDGGEEGFRQVNNHVEDEFQGDVNGVVSNRPPSQRDGEFRIGKVDDNVKDGCDLAAVQENVIPQAPQQQPQGSQVHWERFLHVRSIKVMLVENDDSTRHIVTALLRNCNYEVIEAANGLQAWKILEDLSNHIDIVLTEVVMPCLSGIGLLCKIMSHKTRKDIPVIMMSSLDSMGLVFKCLSKGAVDFLVKPIRKNELKNLWQHVWRRCHSSSGSGSESGTQAQKSVNSKSSLRSDESGSNVGTDNGSSGDGTDDGSGTQSSWTKQAVELDSPQAASPYDQISECPDSTCGLVIRPAETPAARGFHDQKGQPDIGGKGKKLSLVRSKGSEMQTKFPVKLPVKRNGIEQDTLQKIDSRQNIRSKEKVLADIAGENSSGKHKATDINMPDSQLENGEMALEPEKLQDTSTKVIDDANGVTVGELSLKRPRGVKDEDREVQNGRNSWRHSELSAFTRYNTTSNAVKSQRGITASSSHLENRSEVVKKESMRDTHSDGYLNYQGSNEVGNDVDVGYSANKYCTNPLIQNEMSEARSLNNYLHSSSTFIQITTDPRYCSQQFIPRKADDIPPTDVLNPPRELHQELPVQHIHHHHHVHHYHNIDTKQPLSNHDDLSLKELAADALHCGSSNVLGGAVEGNPENYSLNRSVSGSKHGSGGSKHGSNGQNGSSTAVNVEGINVESDVALTGKSGSGDASRSGSGNRTDQHRSAQREAALTKFRQKRKERCFQKKVRYQNRKRLAEQRPRVRGQFVKQTGRDSSSNAADG